MAHALADSKDTPQARLECADSCLKGSGGFIRLWARVQGCLHNDKNKERPDDDILKEYLEMVEIMVFKGKMQCKQYTDLQDEVGRHQAMVQNLKNQLAGPGSSENKKQLQKKKECAQKAVDNLDKRIRAWGIATESAEVWHQEVHLRKEVSSHLKLLYFSVAATYMYRNFTSHLKGGQDATRRMPPERVRYCLGTYSRFFRCLLEIMEDSSIEEDTRAFLAGYKTDADARVTARNKLERALQLDEWALCCTVLMAGQIQQWDLQKLEPAQDMLFYFPWPSINYHDTEKNLAKQAFGWLQTEYGTPVIWKGGNEVELDRKYVLDDSQRIWRQALLVMLCRGGRIGRGIDWTDQGLAILLLQELIHWDELPSWAQEEGSGRLTEHYAWISEFLSGKKGHPTEEVEHLLKGMSQFSELSRRRGFNTKAPLERMCLEAVQQSGEHAIKNLIGNTFCKVPISSLVEKLLPSGPIPAHQNMFSAGPHAPPPSISSARTSSGSSSLSESMQSMIEGFKAIQMDVSTPTGSHSGLELRRREKGDHVLWAESLDGTEEWTYVGTVDKDAHGLMVILRNVHRHMTDDAKPYDGQYPVEKEASALKPFPEVDQLSESDTLDICKRLINMSTTGETCEEIARYLVDEIADANLIGTPKGMETQLKQLWAEFKLPKPDYRYIIRKRLQTAEDRPANRCNIMKAVLRLLDRFGNSCAKELQTLLKDPAYQLAKQPVNGRIILGCSAVIALSAFCVTWRGELQGQLSELVQGSILTVCGLKKGSLVVEVEGPMEGLLELHASLLKGPMPTFRLSNLGTLPIIRVELISITSTALPYRTLECPPGVQDMDVLVPGLVAAFGLDILPRPVERTNTGGMACVCPQKRDLDEPNHQDLDFPEGDPGQAQVQLPIEPGLFVRWTYPKPDPSGGQRIFTAIVVRLMPREIDLLGNDGDATGRAEVRNIHEHMQNDVPWSSEVDVAILQPCPAPKKLPAKTVQLVIRNILSQLKHADEDPDAAIRKSAQLLSSVLKAITVANGLEASTTPLEDLVALRDAFLLQPEVFWQIQPFTADKWRQLETYSITDYKGSTDGVFPWIHAVRLLLVGETGFADLSDEQNLDLERAGAAVTCAPKEKASDERMGSHGRELDPGLKELARQALASRGYTLMEKVGSGGFGFVYRVVKDNVSYAVKIEEPECDESKRMKQETRLRREIRIHQKLNHPNIVKFYEEIALFNGWPIVVMELVTCRGSPCSLGNFISDLGRPLKETEAIVIFRELIRAVEFMHQVFASDLDIKLGNALLDDEGHVKLCDFGFAKVEGEDSIMNSSVGTIQYLAPELAACTQQRYDGKAVDVWCCGIVLYHMVTGYTPWDRPGDEQYNQMELILAVQGRILQSPLLIARPETLEENSACWNLIQAILTADPARRPTIAQIKQHPYFTTGLEYGWHERTRKFLEEGRIDVISEAEADGPMSLGSLLAGIPSIDVSVSGSLMPEGLADMWASMHLQPSDQFEHPPEDLDPNEFEG